VATLTKHEPGLAPIIGGRTRNKATITLRKLIAYAVIVPMAVAYVFPFYWMVATSLKSDQEIFKWPPVLIPEVLHWENYPAALVYIPFWSYMKNTFVIAGLTVLGTVLSSAFIAYGFARIRWRGRDAIFLIYLSTIMLPFHVTMIPLYVLFKQLGWIGTILPLVVPAFFGNAFFVFLLRQFFLTIPLELSEAALVDGSSELRTFLSIILPLSKPALASVALFTFLASYRDFLGPLIYLNSQEDWTISLGLNMFRNMYGAQWQLMMAASTVALLPVVILFFLTQRTFVQGITMTGVKG
jgi:multiple sugar transport system permease protein